ncbi:MAG: ATP-binding cassette domain-containing protein [Proteobacteria bacterium]|nr:ATP-binding cassette domain-containing protein [Pseudomonadota bacterium]
MSLLNFDKVFIDFGAKPILDVVDFSVEKGQKIALIGRNGEGKSTLLKIMADQIPIDDGRVGRQDGLKVAMMDQSAIEQSSQTEKSIYQYLCSSLGDVGDALYAYQKVIDTGVGDLEPLQHIIDENDGWDLLNRIETVISKLDLNKDTTLSNLSGGLGRRANLASALVQSPDILLLDEPTNHLDIETIIWLQNFIIKLNCAVVFVTHDRSFLNAIANGIIELDRGKIFQYDCGYQKYLERREDRLNAQVREWERLDKKLSQEEVWVRQGVKARRTRSQSRVRDLLELRKQRSERREVGKDAKASINVAEAGGKKVMVAHKISYGYGEQLLIDQFSSKILRGDKVGIIGPNGVGKTTLVKLLIGELEPQAGSIKLGTGLEVAYFDQLKQTIDFNDTVENNLQLGTDFVTINGKPRHVISYLQDFLFSAEKIRGPASVLSGGEQSRLLLARLFSRPANVLILDEPTNDLDMETLDLLADLLFDFPGTVLLISHDRDFIDQICTQTIVFENPLDDTYQINEYIGGYEDYLRQRKPILSKEKPKGSIAINTSAIKKNSNKLSFKLKHELDQLPIMIDELEAELEKLSAQMCETDFYQKPAETVKTITAKVNDLKTQLEKSYSRWDELEAME